MRTLDFVEKNSLRRDLPPFRVGDAVRVHVKVKEGEKERIQVFEGLVTRRRGTGLGETFSVRKVSSGVGVERIFPVQSPLVAQVDIKSRGFVRRSRLYYLRDLSGKKARLRSKVRDLSDLLSPDQIDARDSDAPAAEEALPEVVEAASAETTADDAGLRGKARKKARAKEKADRKAGQEAAAARRKAEEPAPATDE